MAFSPIRERISKFWPLLIFLFITFLCFARVDISLLERISTYCDVRKVMEKSSSEEALGFDSRNPRLGNTGMQKAESKTLPNPVAITLLHYATTTITPQQSHAEIMVTLKILGRRGPCNLLVYGLGHDSPLWQALNHGGHTVFLEEDPKWIKEMVRAHPSLQAYHVNYSTMLLQADELLAYARNNIKGTCSPQQDLLLSDCKLAIKTLPPHVYGIEWDVIMIDAPRGYFPEAPGRMSAIYSSAVMAKRRKRTESTDILLHDVERPVEKTWGTEFLCSKNLIESVGRLWHFQVYGEGPSRSPHFCLG